MKRTPVLLVVLALLLVTAHRTPAPIQEIPESPSPTTAMAPTPGPKPPPPTQPAAPIAAAQPRKPLPGPKPTKETQSADGTIIPKGAVYLVIHTESDARKIFTYFQFPGVHAPPGTTGLYRIEVNPDGTVAAVTILKSMGSDQDIACLKAFVRWRAVPGPLRIVDVPRRIFEFHRAMSVR